MNLPVVAIVGRPNVGKSSLFNRFIGNKTAIVADVPGVTRDRIFGKSNWNGKDFNIIDTGGLDIFSKDDDLVLQVIEQVNLAILEADLILFVVDGKEGIVPMDLEVANILRKTKKKVLVVVNKIDNFDKNSDIFPFYDLGFELIFPVSSIHGMGIGDLLDKIIALLPFKDTKGNLEESIAVSIIGRPNVGKSSILNALLNEERVIVSDIPGTTRDCIDTFLSYEGKNLTLIDTAGIRKKAKVNEGIEKYSVIRSIRAINRSLICLIVLDASQGILEQDKKIAGLAHEAGCSSIFLVNKWDLVVKNERTTAEFEKNIKSHFSFMSYAPIIFISAKYNLRIHKILPEILKIAAERFKRIDTSILNQVIQEGLYNVPLPSKKGIKLQLKYITQTAIDPPTFSLFVNNPELVHFSYLRFIENRLRQAFLFYATPILFAIKKK